MLEKKEIEILKTLRQNSRTQLTKLARKLKIPITSMFKITKNLERKFIKKYTTLIDFKKLNYFMRIFVISSSKEKKELQKFLITHPRVNNVYKVSGDSDLISEVILKDRKEMEFFLEKLEQFNIKENQVIHIIEELKKESFVNF